MEVQFEGTLTKDEYLSLSKLATRPIFKKKGMFIFDLWLVLIVVGAVMVAVSVWQFIVVRESFTIWFILLIFGFLAFAVGVKLRAAPHKMWEQHEVLRIHREGRITQEVLEIHTSQGEWRLFWEDLTGYGEYKDIIALFQGPSAPIPFPRRFFKGEEDWNAFWTIVAEKLEVSHRVAPVETSRIFLFIIILIAVFALVVKATTGLSGR